MNFWFRLACLTISFDPLNSLYKPMTEILWESSMNLPKTVRKSLVFRAKISSEIEKTRNVA